MVIAPDGQWHAWFDLDRPKEAADGTSVPDLGAAEAGRRAAISPKVTAGEACGLMLPLGKGESALSFRLKYL
jgi:hypothetical protein